MALSQRKVPDGLSGRCIILVWLLRICWKGLAIKYRELNGSLVNVKTEVTEEDLIWDIRPAFKFNDERLLIFSIEELLSTTYVSCRFLFGRNIDIKALYLSYPRPSYADLYKELTQAPVYFNSKKNLLMVSADVLDMPTITGHLSMKDVCEEHCRKLMLKLTSADQFIEDIRELIIESRGRFPTVEEVAGRLNVSRRTLFRRLQEQGTTYQKLLDEVRSEIARDYLGKTNLSVDQVSELIGFRETNNERS